MDRVVGSERSDTGHRGFAGHLAVVGPGIVVAATLAHGVAAAGPSAVDGTIAYLTSDRTAVHLVAPDGSDDRVAWTVPDGSVHGIQDVEWSPDGSRLAIASGHEALCSVYQYDLYTLRPDGRDLQRVTNPPACGDLAGTPTGAVSVTVANLQDDPEEFLVYVAGAPEAELVTIETGYQITLEFPAVADLGPGVPQAVVASNGSQRWFSAAVTADVLPGETVDAGTLVMDGSPIDTFGAVSVTWSPDGEALGYQFGQGALWQVGADPASGAGERPLLDLPDDARLLGSDLAWSPVADEVLYERFDTDPWTISRATVDGTGPGQEIVTVRLTHGIDWLPDGSGFVVSASDSLLASADLYLVNLASGAATTLTSGDAFAYWPSVSPDGRHIAYTRIEGSPDAPTSIELHTMAIDGSSDEVIAPDAIGASWGPATVP